MNDVKNQALTVTNALALEHLALYSTKVALARWGSGLTWNEMQATLALKPSCQAQWHNSVQDDFKSWLAAGGFAAGFAADGEALAPAQGYVFASTLVATHAS